MKIGNTALVIDDNRMALTLSSKLVQAAAKDFNVICFVSAKAAMDYLEKADELPSVIFSDLNMEEINGLEFLAWCKRHPKVHQLPIVILTAETQQADLTPQGAIDLCIKPLSSTTIDAAFHKAKQKFMCFSHDESIDSAFLDETFELCSRMKEVMQTPLGEKEVNEIYRIFHTIKGVSASIDYNYLAQFVHKAENFLTYIKNNHKFQHPQVLPVLNGIYQYFINALTHLKELQVMPEVPKELLDKILNVKDLLHTDEKILIQPQDSLVSNISNIDTVNKSDTIRIKHKQLDDIQGQLKKILQIKVQLNHFGRQLHEEFYDEAFPKELVQMVNHLENASINALESLIMLRVQPLDLLNPYAEKLVNELGQKLNKNCQIIFNKKNSVEVDTPIIELMKAALTHILRNAMDHGIETRDDRLAVSKSETGLIEVTYEKLQNKTFKVEIKDNGRGIVSSKLKKALIEKNILSEEQLNVLSEDQLHQMIFVDGLSTKEAVSDISGRGVGISAVKDDIEKMGGTLLVESKEGFGTKFIITLPLYFVL